MNFAFKLLRGFFKSHRDSLFKVTDKLFKLRPGSAAGFFCFVVFYSALLLYFLKSIQLNPGEKGFMPFKHPKLSDSTINVFVKWKEDGLLEK